MGHVFRDGVTCAVCGKSINHGIGRFECRYPNQQGRVMMDMCLACTRVVHGYIRTMESQFKAPVTRNPRVGNPVESYMAVGASVPEVIARRNRMNENR